MIWMMIKSSLTNKKGRKKYTKLIKFGVSLPDQANVVKQFFLTIVKINAFFTNLKNYFFTHHLFI